MWATLWNASVGLLLNAEALLALSAIAFGAYALLTDRRTGLEEEYQGHRSSFKHMAESYRRQAGQMLRLRYPDPRGKHRGAEILEGSDILVTCLAWYGKPWRSKPYFALRSVMWPETLRGVRSTPFSAKLSYAQYRLFKEWEDWEKKEYVPSDDEATEMNHSIQSTRANAARVAGWCIKRWRQGRRVRWGIIASALFAIAAGLGALLVIVLKG